MTLTMNKRFAADISQLLLVICCNLLTKLSFPTGLVFLARDPRLPKGLPSSNHQGRHTGK